MKTSVRTKNGYGDFGALSECYRTARKDFPNECVSYILEKTGVAYPSILDIGCGTGIATMQLREKGARVIGTDIDTAMIRQAKINNKRHIPYLIAPAERQPFHNHFFDAVTAFSAFHWFANKQTLDEIKRLLKPKGVFFAINKNEVGDFKKDNKEILKRFIGLPIPDAKKGYKPKRFLTINGFRDVTEQCFFTVEYFTIGVALEYIQTMSVWNLVPTGKRTSALEALHSHLFSIAHSNNGTIERKIEVVVISGTP